MEPQVVSYLQMCSREGVNLQAGMNFQLGGHYSVILMSVRPNAPYRDELLDDGTTLIYEGHDTPRTNPALDPKAVDQPERTSAGNLTQNGKFHQAAQAAKSGTRPPELVRVYERLQVQTRGHRSGTRGRSPSGHSRACPAPQAHPHPSQA